MTDQTWPVLGTIALRGRCWRFAVSGSWRVTRHDVTILVEEGTVYEPSPGAYLVDLLGRTEAGELRALSWGSSEEGAPPLVAELVELSRQMVATP